MAEDNNKYLDLKNETLDSLLAKGVEGKELEIAMAILAKVEKGDASALKFLERALNKMNNLEENRFPISDARFKEIILAAADRIRYKQQPKT